MKRNSDTNKIPIRTCIACRSSDMKRSLVRLVRKDNKIAVDETGKSNGRGAYIHASQMCFDEVMDGKKLSRALRVEIRPDELVVIKDQMKVIIGQVGIEVTRG